MHSPCSNRLIYLKFKFFKHSMILTGLSILHTRELFIALILTRPGAAVLYLAFPLFLKRLCCLPCRPQTSFVTADCLSEIFHEVCSANCHICCRFVHYEADRRLLHALARDYSSQLMNIYKRELPLCSTRLHGSSVGPSFSAEYGTFIATVIFLLPSSSPVATHQQKFNHIVT